MLAFLYVPAVLAALWLLSEILVRVYLGWSLATDFYGSISRHEVGERQRRCGVQVVAGIGWAHLGWVADPERERYRIEQRHDADWKTVARVRFGSRLVREAGDYRVWAEPRDGSAARLLGEARAAPRLDEPAPICMPRRAGAWRKLFRPKLAGDYINDHAVYRDAEGRWRLVGITGPGDGDYAREKRFAVGVAEKFPPPREMTEAPPVADFGELAWAPHVIEEAGTYFLFWSPHRLQRLTSSDGREWSERRVVMATPFHRFFRDATVIKVGPGQWLLYATGRGRYFSRVDVYQSFDLEGWQYIGAALRAGWGSERNSIVASTESPQVVEYRDRYYLSLTYNNDSFVWATLLLPLKVWRRRASYNDTLIFHADNPYAFGEYRGRRRAPTLVAQVQAHAAKLVHETEGDCWYITTAGWPWVATLTAGEVAVAPLAWDEVSGGGEKGRRSDGGVSTRVT